jgi:hypothetical protein
VLDLDVFGNLDADVIGDKIVEVAMAKQAELPVIVILSSIAECEQLKIKF